MLSSRRRNIFPSNLAGTAELPRVPRRAVQRVLGSLTTCERLRKSSGVSCPPVPVQREKK